MRGLEPRASCSQSKRATNCATPGYEIFQLWSNMWSTPIFDQLPATGKVLSAQLSQGFPGFPRAVARTRASRSQSRRATNCATPRYEVVGLPGRILPKGKYLCANCTEENREQTLRKLIHIAQTEYGVEPRFTVQLIVVSGILQWNYEAQVYVDR